jgi:tetratricopeptide (TPR) repeat protein
MDIHEQRTPTAPVDRSAGLRSRNDATKADTPESDHIDASRPAQTEIARRVQLGFIASDREILLRGRRAFERGEDESALESLTRLTAHGVRYADVYYMVGILQERLGNLDDAFASLRESIRINPAYAEALLALASLHERRGEFELSQGFAERASQLSRQTGDGLDPTTRGKLANQQAVLADALAAAGERRDAIEQYRRALDRCPTFHDIRHRLGVALREAGLPAQAAQEFQRVLRLHPGLLESQIQLGLTYYSMGRTPEAVRQWNEVLEKDPSRDDARMYLRLVRGTGRAQSQASPIEELSFSSPASPALDPLQPASDESNAGAVAGWSTTDLFRADAETLLEEKEE